MFPSPHAHLDIGLQALSPLLQSSGPPVGQAFRGEVGHFVQFLDLPGGYRGTITASRPSPQAHCTLASALPSLIPLPRSRNYRLYPGADPGEWWLGKEPEKPQSPQTPKGGPAAQGHGQYRLGPDLRCPPHIKRGSQCLGTESPHPQGLGQ